MTDSERSSTPVTLRMPGIAATLRSATPDDLPSIVALLAADQLGAARDSADDLGPYLQAFEAIARDPAHLLLVADADRQVVGTMQLSFLPGLARRGAWRAQIEAVRVAEAYRGAGLGRAMVSWAVEESGRRGCALVQLTSDKQRTEAHHFYAGLGFTASHEGFKRAL
jgi:ribosomal protein S18 acetylase RimI-like enzyme